MLATPIAMALLGKAQFHTPDELDRDAFAGMSDEAPIAEAGDYIIILEQLSNLIVFVNEHGDEFHFELTPINNE